MIHARNNEQFKERFVELLKEGNEIKVHNIRPREVDLLQKLAEKNKIDVHIHPFSSSKIYSFDLVLEFSGKFVGWFEKEWAKERPMKNEKSGFIFVATKKSLKLLKYTQTKNKK